MSDQYSPWSHPQAPGGRQHARGDQPPAPDGWRRPEQPTNGQPDYAPPGYPLPDQNQPGYQPGGYGQPGYPSAANPQADYPPPGYAPPGYPQPGSHQPGYPAAGYPVAPLRSDYAPWGKRVGALLIDQLPSYVGSIIFYVGYGMLLADLAQNGGTPNFSAGAIPMIIGTVIMLAAIGWTIYNRWITAGRTGQSLGKRVTKITLISDETGRPIGALNAFLRDLVHILDGFAYVGYLWPLWDEKKQTFSDKLMKTIVVHAAQPPH